MGINKAIVAGNLTRDPEIRTTQGGMPVMSFGIAVNERRRNAAGEWEDRPNYIDCTMFGARAESVSRFLSKGSKVAVEGRLRWSQWEKDGERRSKIEIVVDEIEFMSRADAAPAPASDAAPVRMDAMPGVDFYPADIPF